MQQIALIDFGLAKHAALEMEITDPGMIFGTPHYMSPEQGHGRSRRRAQRPLQPGRDPLRDAERAKSRTPTDNPMAIIYMHRNAPLPKLPEELAELQPLLDRLLGKRPEDRFHNATEAGQAIEAARAAYLLNVAALRG